MLKKLVDVSNNDQESVAIDWVVLAAGIISLGMAVTLTATHNANAASPQEITPIQVVTSAY